MTPLDFLNQYHGLTVNDPRLGLTATFNVTNYPKPNVKAQDAKEGPNPAPAKPAVPGSFAVGGDEAQHVLAALPKRTLGPGRFCVEGNPKVSPTEMFYSAGVRRAFWQRGSPDEMRDALRLAVVAGRCTAATADAYVKKWFGQDCNAFVGNYLGASPMLSIPSYATGVIGGNADASQPPCQWLLPRPPRTDPRQVAPGDLILTFGGIHPEHKWRWLHVALVNSFTLTSRSLPATRTLEKGDTFDADPEKWSADLQIVEWGGAGGIEAHRSWHTVRVVNNFLNYKPDVRKGDPVVDQDVVRDFATFAANPTAARTKAGVSPWTKVVGFVGHDRFGKNAFRIILEGVQRPEHRGWHCGGVYGV